MTAPVRGDMYTVIRGDMSTVTFPFPIRVFLHQEVLFDLVVHLVDVSEYEHYTAQAEESVLNSGALNKTFFILER